MKIFTDDTAPAVVLPVPDGSDVRGVGVFTFEVHGCLGFPGDSLP